jgi:hypothetical protein
MEHFCQFHITYPHLAAILFSFTSFIQYRRYTENVTFCLVAGQRKCLRTPAECRSKPYLAPPGSEHASWILERVTVLITVGFKRNRETQKEGGDWKLKGRSLSLYNTNVCTSPSAGSLCTRREMLPNSWGYSEFRILWRSEAIFWSPDCYVLLSPTDTTISRRGITASCDTAVWECLPHLQVISRCLLCSDLIIH